MNKLKGLWSCAWFYHWAPLLRSEGLQCSRAAVWIRFNLVTLFMCHLYSRQSIAFSWNHLAHQVMWLLLQTLVYGGLGKCRLWGRPEVLEGGWFVTQNIKNWEIRGLLLKIRIFNYFTEFPTFFWKLEGLAILSSLSHVLTLGWCWLTAAVTGDHSYPLLSMFKILQASYYFQVIDQRSFYGPQGLHRLTPACLPVLILCQK